MKNTEGCGHIQSLEKIKSAKHELCEECVKIGSSWVHLRTCQTCGVTLCCDSSPQQHMSHHCRKSLHPIISSSEPGERWLYCFIDDLVVSY